MDEMGFFVSQNLHHDAIKHIFYAPMSFFDTTVSSYTRLAFTVPHSYTH